MLKHVFWGFIVLMLGLLGAYVGLTVTGHPNQANDLGGFIVVLLIGGFIALFYA